MSIINQYSFLWLAALGLGLLALVLTLRRLPARYWVALAAAGIGVAAAYAALRPTPGVASPSAQLESALATGSPVLVELQSPY